MSTIRWVSATVSMRCPVPPALVGSQALEPCTNPRDRCSATKIKPPALRRVEDRDRRTSNPPASWVRVHRPILVDDLRISTTSSLVMTGGTRHRAHTTALRSISKLCSNESGTTRTSPTVAIKFVSPPQRGMTCTCRCSGNPAPAARP